ncbi:hypothetical protein PoB_004545700 [Plakobranchus ocellatus]|uniref:Uncharacterized protein n=1 Tax=Plakobranchus ocellatus TaxID=259542 RepID=A0AAV4BHW4_9GAST|nr:hypothetical protein PoB_004545700 [Plakobranchus ocellatus]
MGTVLRKGALWEAGKGYFSVRNYGTEAPGRHASKEASVLISTIPTAPSPSPTCTGSGICSRLLQVYVLAYIYVAALDVPGSGEGGGMGAGDAMSRLEACGCSLRTVTPRIA